MKERSNTTEAPPNHTDAFEQLHAELVGADYVDTPAHKGITVNARVRHIGHEWPEARTGGTATVRAVMVKDPSTWTHSWGRPDVELIVQYDDGGPNSVLDGRLTYLADYHVALIPAAAEATS